MRERRVVLVSGGLDSATALAIARADGSACYALSFDYGQRHRCELDAARRVAEGAGVEAHEIVGLDLAPLVRSALVGRDGAIPKDRDDASIGAGVPATYVPARNLVFLSIAIGWAETLGARSVWIGVNEVDYSGYPDCRPAFIEAFAHAAALGTAAGAERGEAIGIESPLAGMSKAEIIARGVELGADYSMTVSCYDPDQEGRACGRCDSCVLRARGFERAGVADPTRYVAGEPV